MKDVVIFGAGGLARETVNTINDGINAFRPGTYNVLGYVVEEQYYKPGTIIQDLPVLGTEKWLIDHKEEVWCVIAIGDYTHERERIFELLNNNGVRLETLVCNDAYVPTTCVVGKGCYIGTGVFLSANVQIGDGTFINSQVMFGHDVKVGKFCNFFPRATISGRCTIGNHVNIGGASYIVPRKKIGDDAVVAAGSIVFSNVKKGTHVLGNPAKRIEL